MSAIVRDEDTLRRKSSPVASTKEGGEIARKLWGTIDRHNKRRPDWRGIGLAAPQIGVHKQVCVLRLNGKPLVLMNPAIVGHSVHRIPAEEGCLSLPGRQAKTWRYIWVEVETLNAGRLYFGPRQPEDWTALQLMWAVVAQHEIAHLHGLLMGDFEQESYPPPEEWKTWTPARPRAGRSGPASSGCSSAA